MWSDCLLVLGTNSLVGNMDFVGEASCLAVAPHFQGLYSSLQLCCEGPCFTSKKIQRNFIVLTSVKHDNWSFGLLGPYHKHDMK